MSRQPNSGEVAAMRLFSQRVDDIQRQLSEDVRQHDRPRMAAARLAHVADIPPEDWDTLLGAIKDRLRWTVGQSQHHGAAAPWQASVLECANALDRLQATLSHALAGPGKIARDEPSALPPTLPLVDAP